MMMQQPQTTVELSLTVDEANRLLSMMVQTPLPYQMSAPIIERIGRALAEYQNKQNAQTRSIFAPDNDGMHDHQHDHLQPVPNN